MSDLVIVNVQEEKTERPTVTEKVRGFATKARQHIDNRLFALWVVLCTLSIALRPSPAYATSFNMSTGDLMSSAADMFNQIWPLMGPVIGISVGLGLVGFVAAAISKAIKIRG